MKFFLTIFTVVISTVYCVPSSGIVNTGSSAVSRSEDGHGNYVFGYNEDHATGGSFRKEKGGPGYQTGSYGLRDADGRMRVVNYVADAHGFRATISTNEPGVDPKQDPAAMAISGEGHAVPAPAQVLAKSYAPAPVAYSAPLQTSSYQTSTAHVAAPPAAYSAPVLAKSYAASPAYGPAPSIPGPIGYAEAPYQTSLQHLTSAPAPTYVPAPSYAPAPVPAPAQIIQKSYSIPAPISHAPAVAAPVPIKAYPTSLAGLAATYSIHTLGSSKLSGGYAKAY